MMQKSICDLPLGNVVLWCTICIMEYHTKDTCQLNYDRHQDVWTIQTKYYCEIYPSTTSHYAKDFPYNMKNEKSKWSAIFK